MPKRFDDAEEKKPKAITSYTIKLDDAQMKKLQAACAAKHWETAEVPYTRFAFKGPKVNVTAYDEVLHPDWFEPHAGLDESGKGDLFGPVVAATVIAEGDAVRSWLAAGVRDSKTIVDAQILKLDDLIRATPGVVVEVRHLDMAEYNRTMLQPFASLNRLLAQHHADALDAALQKKWVPRGLLDQFSKEPLVQRVMKKKGLERFDLQMRTKAEEDPVVAAASIVARAEFVRLMHALSREFGDKLQKGAGALAKAQASLLIEKLGARSLGHFAKLHFRTCYEVVAAAGKLAELPLKEPKEKTEWKR